jgi:hypothetical protein
MWDKHLNPGSRAAGKGERRGGSLVNKNPLAICVCGALLASLCVASASAQITVYNNFGPGHSGWDYNWGLGWTVAGINVPAQYGVEQAMGFTPTASGYVNEIWVAMWYAPPDPQPDVVTLRLVSNPAAGPPEPANIMEAWTITGLRSWSQWNPPIQLIGSGVSRVEQGQFYWLWASGGDTTWAGWCMNTNPALTCPHTLRREGESWLPIGNETASAFRVDIIPDPGCVGDLNGDGRTDLADLGILLGDFGCVPPGPCVGDLNNDGRTDLADLGILLGDFGCEP